MPGGLSAILAAPPPGVIPSQAPDAAARYSLVVPAMAVQAPDAAQRQLLGILTPTELMAEIVALDGGLDVVR
jgi:hypothetical protein